VELSLDILSQFLWHPLLREKDLERERGVILEEINMYEDTPMKNVSNIFDQLMYKGSDLGRDVIGSRETVKSVKQDDFVKYMNRWYGPQNIVLGVAGDETKIRNSNDEVPKMIREYFGGKSSKVRPRSFASRTDLFGSSEPNSGVKVMHKKTEQAHFVLGVKSLPRGHKDRYVQSVLATILGGNMSSRMFTEVREKRGLAYYVKTGVGVYNEVGHLATQAGVTIDKIDEAVGAVRREYEKVCKKSEVSGEELKKAKQYLIGQLKISLEDSQEVVGNFVDSLLLEGKVRTPEEAACGVEAVTADDIVRFSNQLFGEKKYSLAVIGPKHLKLGPFPG